ncbi:MAG: hypothetical protein IJF76_03560, partial [Clostridia bacterium]|nr:hypothetical protein [Clostridia bacterium]
LSIDEECTILDKITSLELNREEIGNYFIRLKKVFEKNRFRTVDSVFLSLLLTPDKKTEFYVVWQILEDVGLIEYNVENNAYIIKNTRTELTKSDLYCIINCNG